MKCNDMSEQWNVSLEAQTGLGQMPLIVATSDADKVAGSEKLNRAVREHEVDSAWDYRELAKEMFRWFDIFNEAFFDGKLPTCFLQIDRERISCLGHYRPGKNGVGAEHEINLNSRHLNGRLKFEVLGTLLHEMAHEWEALFGKPGHRNYHTKKFTNKCSEMGIPCTGGYRSVTLGYNDPFVSLLRQYGVKAEIIDIKIHAPQSKGKSTLNLWTCGCTKIRAGREVDAICQKCQGHFEKAT